jgi:hypothetical protein
LLTAAAKDPLVQPAAIFNSKEEFSLVAPNKDLTGLYSPSRTPATCKTCCQAVKP